MIFTVYDVMIRWLYSLCMLWSVAMCADMMSWVAVSHMLFSECLLSGSRWQKGSLTPDVSPTRPALRTSRRHPNRLVSSDSAVGDLEDSKPDWTMDSPPYHGDTAPATRLRSRSVSSSSVDRLV